MNAAGLHDLALQQGVLRDPEAGSDRFVVWAENGGDGLYTYWERISTALNSAIKVETGFRAVIAASVIPARRKLRIGLGDRIKTMLGRGSGRLFRLPDGPMVEQCGERKSVVLVVTIDDGNEGDDGSIHSRWPSASRVKQLGPALYLVESPHIALEGGEPGAESPTQSPREHIERVLLSAREGGDRSREATALTDLGVLALNEGQTQAAVGSLENALQIVRELNDRGGEYDILGHVGMAALALRQPDRAREIFNGCLAEARTRGDQYAEKMSLERLGLALSGVGDSDRAIHYFDQALTIARFTNDRQQQANLLWFQAVQLAESGQRDAAIAKGDEAVKLTRDLGRPQAAVLGSYLQKYRMGLDDNGLPTAPTNSSAWSQRDAFLGGSIATSVSAANVSAGAGLRPVGPSLLRKALSATKAMANYAGSGFKSTPRALQRKRVDTCSSCEHHTGMRCRVCGCFTEIKSRMLHEDCPIGKWPKSPPS